MRECHADYRSALATFSLARFGSSVSVLDFLMLGSSLALRGFARCGSALSVTGLARFGSEHLLSPSVFLATSGDSVGSLERMLRKIAGFL